MCLKKFLLFTCGLLMCANVQAQEFENAKDAVKNMGVGWNLGNTLDANDATKTWTTTAQHETCWGQPVTKPELLKMMKEAGFGAIRVPVTWYQEMDSNGKVNDAWMNRVKEVVDYVIDNGMYCILNVHHDTGADGGSFKSWLKASTNSYNANKAKYEGLWKQIAEKFKDYDQKLLFEAYNEMLDEKNTWNEPIDKTDGYNAINSYAKSFVTTVRNTGGNNAKRNLVVNTYSASSVANAMKQLELPETTGHIIFQLHSYPNWQSESNAKNEIDNLINNIKTNLLNRAPVIIGEYSTFCEWPTKIDYYDSNRKVAFYAMDYMIKKTKENGIATFYWMGLSDGAARTLPAFNQPDLAETLIKAYYGSTSGYKYPSTEDFNIIYTVNYKENWSELFLYGDYSNTATLKLSDYKGIRVELDNDTYVEKLQVKIYGKASGKEDCKPITGTVTTIPFADLEATIGSEISKITLQTMIGAQTAKVIKASLIKSDDSETPGTITAAWGCDVSTEVVTPSGIRSISETQNEGEGHIYNLNGQRVKNPSKGIYIQNGKKFIAK